MKARFLAGVLTTVLAMSVMMGCSKGTEKEADTAAKPVEAETKEEPPAEPVAEKEKADVYVFIAASLSNAMEEIKTSYTAEHPEVNILFNADSSGTLQTQIEEGAQCDIFFSAATKQMDELMEGGYIEAPNVKDLLENKVVLIKPAGVKTSVTGFADIMNASTLALAGEDVPVGQYARKIFDKLGITEQVMAMQINEGANVTAVLTSVSEKSNDIGIVYATDAASMKDSVEIIKEAGSEELDEQVTYPVGLVKDEQGTAAQTEAAKEFYAYLQTEAAASVFQNYGFSVNQ